MTAEIIKYPGITRHDLDAQTVLEEACKLKFQDVLIIGYDEEGDFIFQSSKADGGLCLWLLEYAKRKLLDAAEEMED
jgi:hypothetical protein